MEKLRGKGYAIASDVVFFGVHSWTQAKYRIAVVDGQPARLHVRKRRGKKREKKTKRRR